MNVFPLIPTGWEICKLYKVAEKCTKKNKNHDISLVLTNSALHGVVIQSEHFSKEIAVDENIRDYYVIEPGEFVYNPRISVTASCGPIRRNHLGFRGVMSPLYTIFKLKNGKANDRFLEYYFLSPSWHKFAKSVANYGARHDRMAIKDDDFFAMPIPLPPLPEQKRIAEILTEQDKLIALKERLIAAKKKQKKWLMQNLLTGKIRLKGFSGEWENMIFKRILVECERLKGTDDLEICSVAVNKGIINQIEHLGRSYAANNTENYHVVTYGDIVYTKSPTGDFPFGIVKQSQLIKTVAVSPLYGVFKPSNYFIGRFLDFYFQSHINSNNYLRKIVNKGAKNTILVNNADFLKGSLRIPNNKNEQQDIAERLTAADQEIELLTKELEAHKQVKKYLMQQLLTGKIRVTGGDL